MFMENPGALKGIGIMDASRLTEGIIHNCKVMWKYNDLLWKGEITKPHCKMTVPDNLTNSWIYGRKMSRRICLVWHTT